MDVGDAFISDAFILSFCSGSYAYESFLRVVVLENLGSFLNWRAFQTPPPPHTLASPVRHCIDMNVHSPYQIVSIVWLGCFLFFVP